MCIVHGGIECRVWCYLFIRCYIHIFCSYNLNPFCLLGIYLFMCFSVTHTLLKSSRRKTAEKENISFRLHEIFVHGKG